MRGEAGGGGSVARRGEGGTEGERENDGDCRGRLGVRGAMRPSVLSTLRGRKGITENTDLNKDVGAALVTILGGIFGLGDGMELSIYKSVVARL